MTQIVYTLNIMGDSPRPPATLALTMTGPVRKPEAPAGPGDRPGWYFNCGAVSEAVRRCLVTQIAGGPDQTDDLVQTVRVTE